MSDLENLKNVADQRDDQAFCALFAKYGPLVKAFMMRLGADAATAEELAQETMLTVWRKAGLYSRDKGGVSTWIFTIARNLRIDRLRREDTWVEIPDGYEREPSAEATPEEAISGEQRRSKVKRAID